ncbi:beta strand repeat-containing protein [Comamonas flocculans]|uniref:IPTL-CTERM sorting domain-containing protein n=1 Tax=Comamonas flocculans TaxID=2597701 RepID=A0A5B8RT13_9BURK|nr:IPTL-CTERM sorting domain-containing protein [Comamonas flocculans]QEA12621.1 IPTL-CTERM sorting domain-containing protein [Comamonas flocculans]
MSIRSILGGLALLPCVAFATTTINQSFVPDTLFQGDPSTYTVKIWNDSTQVAVTDVAFTALLDLPGALPAPKISVITPLDTTISGCGAGAALNADPGTNTVQLTGATVAAGTGSGSPGECVVTVKVSAAVSGNHIVSIPENTDPTPTISGFTYTENGKKEYNTTDAKATLLVRSMAAPRGSKTFSPSPSFTGRPTTLTITLTNPNVGEGQTIPLTTFTDTLPTGMVVAPVPNASVTCTGTGFSNGTFSPGVGDTAVTLAGGTIGVNGTCEMKVDVVVNALTPANAASQTFDNIVAAGAIGNIRGLSSPTFHRQVQVRQPISMAKSFTPSTIPVNAPSMMEIVVTNNGGTALTNAGFVDNFPAGLVGAGGAASVTCTSGTDGIATVDTVSNPNKVTLTGATVAANGGTCTIEVPVTSTTEGAYKNELPANAVTNDQGISSPAIDATLNAYAQLQVEKTVTPANVAPGQWATFTVNIRNYANGPVNNLQFTDVLPTVNGHPMLVDASQGPAGCGMGFSGIGTNTLSGTNGSIGGATMTAPPSPGLCTVTFRALVPADAATGETFVNTLPTSTAASGTGPGGATSNTNTVSRNVAVVDAVDLTKAFSPTSIASGQTSQLTITVFNRTVSPMTAIDLTDNLPAGLVLAANPAASTTCGAGALTAVPGDNKIKLTGGSALARPGASESASCTITALVTATAPATYTNTLQPADFTSSAGKFVGPRSANLAVTAGLAAVKSFVPASVGEGGVARATVTLTNQTNGVLTNVSINDTGLSGGLTVANPANAATSCGGAPMITANPGATSVRLDGVRLDGAQTCDLSFDVLANGVGPWVNTIPINQITSAEGPSNAAPVTATLGKESADLSLNKAFNPLLVTGNEPSVLTITVINNSAQAINNVSFTDVFPSGIQVYSAPDAQTTCTGGTVAATPGGTQVGLTGAALAGNGACTVTLKVTSVAYLNLTNTIPAGAVTSQGGYTNLTPTSATLSTLQGLGVSKGFEPTYVAPNEVSRLKIKLVNTFDPNIQNPVVLTGLTFTDVLPSGLVFAAVPNPAATCIGAQINVNTLTQALTLSHVTLSPGATCDVEVNVTAASLGAYLNNIPAGAITTDQGVTNPTPGEATLNVVDGPTVGKSFSPATVTVDQTSQLIVTVNNPAAVALTGVALTDNLPPHVAVANPANTTTTCTSGSVTALPGASTVSLSGASIPAGGSCQFRAMVVASQAGTFKNTIGAKAVTNQQGLTNGNPTDADLNVLAPPEVSKRFAPSQIASGGDISTLYIRLENSNATPITLTAALVDALPGLPAPGPGQISVAPVPNVNGHVPGGETACTAGSVTAGAGANSITYGSGATIPAGGCTITVDVVGSHTGNYLNTIAAGQLKTSAGNNPEPANATLGVDKPAAPTVLKAFNPTQIAANGVSRLTITLGNPNATALTLAGDMTDTLPTGVLVAPTPGIGGTCPGAVTAAAGTGTVVYATGASIPSAGCTIEVNVTAAVAGSYTNTIPAGGLVTNEAGSNPTPAVAGLVVTSPNNPTVLKAFSPGTINPGGVSTLTITLGNPNAAAATLTADLVDTLPADVLVADPPALGGSCTGTKEAAAGGGAVTYKSGGTIPANGSCTITVNVTSAAPGGPYVNTIAAGDLKTSVGNNGAPATANLLVNPGQPPSVSKSFSPASIASGGQSTLTISLGNGNAKALTLTSDMVDTLNNMEAVMPAVTTGTTCDAASVEVAAGNVTYKTGGTIPAGGCVIAVRVTSLTAGTWANTIAANALKTDGGNNPVGTAADLTVVTVAPGTTASLSGNVYHDRNDNGLIDPGEEGIGGVTINLLQGGSVIATTTTNGAGQYSFTNLPPGTYTVQEVQPAGWTDGKDTAGSNGGTVTNDSISGIVLVGGDAATDYNFGEHKIASPASIPTLSEWGLILLSLMLGLLAWRQHAGARRRRM